MTEFNVRFDKHRDELEWLYRELYHNDSQAWEYFVGMIRRAWEARPEALKKLDLEREKDPYWYKRREITGMLMYADMFAGTLRGVSEKLNYITDCGVNYLHLMPLLDSPEDRSDGGYAVSDFRKVRPDLGDTDDLAELAEKCHERGICLCLDFVMNHTSEDHAWALRAKAGEKEYQDRYFFYDNWDIPREFERTVPQVFPTTAPGNFTWCEQAGKVVMTTFYPFQWDLNYANPTVFNDMTDDMLFLCNLGIDVIRLDAVPYIWKELGTRCRNLPQVHTLVRMMRIVCEIVCPGTLLLGEVVMEPRQVVPYFGTVDKPECHLLYNVTTMASLWHTTATKDVRLLSHQLGQIFALPKQYLFLNYLRCHDDIGWVLDYDFLANFEQYEVPHKKFLNDYLTGNWPGSPARGELYNDDPTLGDARLCGTTASLCGITAAKETGDTALMERSVRFDLTLHAFMFSLSGIPVIYSGDEIAQENDVSYHFDPFKAADSRFLHRGHLDYDKAAQRHDPSTAPGQIFSGIGQLEELRAAHPAFGADADTWIEFTGSDHVLGIGRYVPAAPASDIAGKPETAGTAAHPAEKVICLYNFSEFDQTVWIGEAAGMTDMVTGFKMTGPDVHLPACGFIWLTKEM